LKERIIQPEAPVVIKLMIYNQQPDHDNIENQGISVYYFKKHSLSEEG
jgi:hypothetical protein